MIVGGKVLVPIFFLLVVALAAAMPGSGQNGSSSTPTPTTASPTTATTSASTTTTTSAGNTTSSAPPPLVRVRTEGEDRNTDAGNCGGDESMRVAEGNTSSGGKTLEFPNNACWAEWTRHYDHPGQALFLRSSPPTGGGSGVRECVKWEVHVDGVFVGDTPSHCGQNGTGSYEVFEVKNGDKTVSFGSGQRTIKVTAKIVEGPSYANAYIDWIEAELDTSAPTPTPTPTYGSSAYPYTPAPTPTVTYKPLGNYTYYLIGQSVAQDVWVYGAREVIIRDSKISGNVYVSKSSQILIDRSYVSGYVGIDTSIGLTIAWSDFGSSLGIHQTESFHVYDTAIAGDLFCFQSYRGTFQNLRIAGHAYYEDCPAKIDNVQSAQPFAPTISYVFPTEPTIIKLNVTSSNLEFSYEKVIRPQVSAAVTLKIDAAEARANLELESETGEALSPVNLKSHFEKLREFEDRDGNGAYDLSDLIVREYLIDELEVCSLHQERLSGADAGWRGRIDYCIPDGGTLGLIFTAKDEAPDDTKIDIDIENYRYKTPRSQLALQVRLASASDWKILEGDEEDRLVFRGATHDGYFGWVNYAHVDGDREDVKARVLEEHRNDAGEREIVLTLAYARGRHIFHDPSIGLMEALGLEDLDLPKLGNLLVYGSTFVAVVIVLWALGQGGKKSTRRP